MRILTNNEIHEANGGIAPIIGAAAVFIVDLAFIAAIAGMMSGAEEQAVESKNATKHKCTLY